MDGLNNDYFVLMSQVGITAFTLMFAAVQFRWRVGSATRLGKLAAGTALFELLTVTLVSVAVATGLSPIWIVVAAACAAVGIAGNRAQIVEHRRRSRAGYFPTPAEDFQMSAAMLPFMSYSILAATAALWVSGPWLPAIDVPLLSNWDATLRQVDPRVFAGWLLAGDLLWLLMSGLVETLVTLSPQLLEPESKYTMDRMPHAKSHALRVRQMGKGPARRGIVLMTEIWGITSGVRRIAQRLADLGYVVVVPDYYQGNRRLLATMSMYKTIGASTEKAIELARDARAALIQDQVEGGIDVLGMSMGADAALAELGLWNRVVALYPEEPASNSGAGDAQDAAAPEQQGVPSAPDGRVLILYASKERTSSSSERRRGDLEKRYVGSDVREIAGRHSFFAGRGIPLLGRVVAWFFAGAAYSREASEIAWTKIESFLK